MTILLSFFKNFQNKILKTKVIAFEKKQLFKFFIIFFLIINLYYFITIIAIDHKTKQFFEKLGYAFYGNEIKKTIGGYPFLPEVNFSNLRLKKEDVGLSYIVISNLNVKSKFNNFDIKFKELEFFLRNRRVILQPKESETINLTYKIKPSRSSLNIPENKIFLKLTGGEYSQKDKEIKIKIGESYLNFDKNSDFEKKEINLILETEENEDLNKYNIKFNIIKKFNDKMNIDQIYKIDKIEIKNMRKNKSENTKEGVFNGTGEVIFQKNNNIPMINFQISVMHFFEDLDNVKKEIKKNTLKLPANVIDQMIFWIEKILPRLKQNEIRKSPSDSLNIDILSEKSSINVNNISILDIYQDYIKLISEKVKFNEHS